MFQAQLTGWGRFLWNIDLNVGLFFMQSASYDSEDWNIEQKFILTAFIILYGAVQTFVV